MKTLKHIALAALTISFAACEQEDFTPSVQGDGDAVKITASIGALQTRVSYDNNGVTTFQSGDEIRVISHTRQNKNKDKSDAVYKFDGAMDWEPTDPAKYVVWEGIADNTFYGVYPATAEYTTFTIPDDQSDDITVADWMTADFTANKSVGNVKFDFRHQLSKVTVNITEWNDEFGGAPQTVSTPKIYSKGTALTATYDDSGVTITTIGDDIAINPLVSGTSYTAIVAPAKYATDDKFMTFSVNGQEMTVLGNSTLTNEGLQAGVHYIFDLKVGKDAVTISSVSVTDWGNGGTIDGGVAKECQHNFVDGICTECGTEAYTYDSSDNTYYVFYAQGLQPAVTEASASGTADSPATVKLMNDMTVGNNGSGANGQQASVIVSSGKIILDLNDCVLTTTSDYVSVDIANYAHLTIIDSSFDKGGTITGSNPVILNNYGRLIVQNGNFINTCSNTVPNPCVVYTYKLTISTNDVSVFINGGTFIGSRYGNVVFVGRNTVASITGGTIKGGVYDISSMQAKFLCFDEVTGNGPSFPGGIAVNLLYSDSKSLSELLDANAAYYNADGDLITLNDGDTSIDGDVIVKRKL